MCFFPFVNNLNCLIKQLMNRPYNSTLFKINSQFKLCKRTKKLLKKTYIFFYALNVLVAMISKNVYLQNIMN